MSCLDYRKTELETPNLSRIDEVIKLNLIARGWTWPIDAGYLKDFRLVFLAGMGEAEKVKHADTVTLRGKSGEFVLGFFEGHDGHSQAIGRVVKRLLRIISGRG